MDSSAYRICVCYRIMDPRLLLTALCSAAELFAFCRFVRARVHRVLPWFSVYLLAGVAQSFVWIAGPPTSRAYANAYALTTPLVIGLQVVVFLELWRKMIIQRPGVDRAAKAFGVAIIGASLMLGLLGGIDGLALHVGVSRRIVFMWISWSVRYTATVLCIACSLLAVCVPMFDRELPRVVTLHAYLLTFYFGSIAAGYLVINLEILAASLVGAFTVGSAAGMYVLWATLITGHGEYVQRAESVEDGSPQGQSGLGNEPA